LFVQLFVVVSTFFIVATPTSLTVTEFCNRILYDIGNLYDISIAL